MFKTTRKETLAFPVKTSRAVKEGCLKGETWCYNGYPYSMSNIQRVSQHDQKAGGKEERAWFRSPARTPLTDTPDRKPNKPMGVQCVPMHCLKGLLGEQFSGVQLHV